MRRAIMELCTSLPDDQVDDGDRILIPGGSVLSGYIRGLITSIGMPTTDPVVDDEHGWQFSVIDGRIKFLLTVTDLEGMYILQIEKASSLFERFFIQNANIEKFVSLVEREIKKSTVVIMKNIEFE